MEVKKAKSKIAELKEKLDKKLKLNATSVGLWNEFLTDLLSIGEVEIESKKIAGVKIPVLKKMVFTEAEFSVFDQPKWFPEGIGYLKEVAEIVTEQEFFAKKTILLDHARRKTTQKVNLYEKVQIPGYEDAIRKIKRFLEDAENLSKSAQKIVKKRQQKQLEEMV